jgi:CO/xanthine dehydrogenase Mo-binding subunit
MRSGSVPSPRPARSSQASVGIGECLDAVKQSYQKARSSRCGVRPRPRSSRRGVGIGAMWYGIGNTGVQNPSTAQIEMNLDGAVTLYTGCADIGQGSTTVLGQIAAGTLGLAPDDIRMIVADTKLTTNAGATSASRQTYISGNAVRDAAAKLADVLLTEAVDLMKIPKNLLAVEGGFVVHKDDPDRRVPFFETGCPRPSEGNPVAVAGLFRPGHFPVRPGYRPRRAVRDLCLRVPCG